MTSPLKQEILWCFINSALIAGILLAMLFFGSQEIFLSLPERELIRTPIGRVHAGARFEQIVEIPPLDSAIPNGFSLCFATYKEKVSGQVTVGISQQNHSASFVLDASKIADNEWVFFPLMQNFKPGPATVKITGTKKNPESAPTIWANEPARSRPLLENDTPTNKNLEIRFFEQKSPWSLLVRHVQSEKIAAFLVLIFSVTTGATMGVLITVITRHGSHKRAESEPA